MKPYKYDSLPYVPQVSNPRAGWETVFDTAADGLVIGGGITDYTDDEFECDERKWFAMNAKRIGVYRPSRSTAEA